MEYRVDIPEELFRIVELRYPNGEPPGIVVVNQSLDDFEPKPVFGWHLQIDIEFADVAAVEPAAESDLEVVDRFGKQLDAAIKRDAEQPNALFLARVTWSDVRELIYRVYDPELVADYLNGLIESGSHPRPFQFEMKHDPEWEQARWYSTLGVEPE